LWKEVTAGLRFNNIDQATTAKALLEQKQRDEAKQRKELNISWENKVNHLGLFSYLTFMLLFS